MRKRRKDSAPFLPGCALIPARETREGRAAMNRTARLLIERALLATTSLLCVYAMQHPPVDAAAWILLASGSLLAYLAVAGNTED